MRHSWLATCLALACAAGSPVAPAPGTSQAFGQVKLVPRAGLAAGHGGASYGDARLRDVEFVDYSRPGFAVVYVEEPPAPLRVQPGPVDGQQRPLAAVRGVADEFEHLGMEQRLAPLEGEHEVEVGVLVDHLPEQGRVHEALVPPHRRVDGADRAVEDAVVGDLEVDAREPAAALAAGAEADLVHRGPRDGVERGELHLEEFPKVGLPQVPARGRRGDRPGEPTLDRPRLARHVRPFPRNRPRGPAHRVPRGSERAPGLPRAPGPPSSETLA